MSDFSDKEARLLSHKEARLLLYALDKLGERPARILVGMTPTDIESLKLRLIHVAIPTDDPLPAVLDAARRVVNTNAAHYAMCELRAALDALGRPRTGAAASQAPTLFR